MKFDCDKKRDRRARAWAASLEWQSTFAFLPIRVGPNDCRWLEKVEWRRLPYATERADATGFASYRAGWGFPSDLIEYRAP